MHGYILDILEIDLLSAKGAVQSLNELYEKKGPKDFSFNHDHTFTYSVNSIEWACISGYKEVIRWWFDHRHTLILKLPNKIIDSLASFGMVDFIQWIYEQSIIGNYKFDYSADAVDFASRDGHINVLEWFWDHREVLPFSYTTFSIDLASEYDHLDILNWFYDRRDQLEIRYTKKAVNLASMNGHIDILDFWYCHQYELKFVHTKKAIKWASHNNRTSVLDWFFERRNEIEFIYHIDAVTCLHDVETLLWWFNHRQPLRLQLQLQLQSCDPILQEIFTQIFMAVDQGTELFIVADFLIINSSEATDDCFVC